MSTTIKGTYSFSRVFDLGSTWMAFACVLTNMGALYNKQQGSFEASKFPTEAQKARAKFWKRPHQCSQHSLQNW
jgi:hypothetical protein